MSRVDSYQINLEIIRRFEVLLLRLYFFVDQWSCWSSGWSGVWLASRISLSFGSFTVWFWSFCLFLNLLCNFFVILRLFRFILCLVFLHFVFLNVSVTGSTSRRSELWTDKLTRSPRGHRLSSTAKLPVSQTFRLFPGLLKTLVFKILEYSTDNLIIKGKVPHSCFCNGCFAQRHCGSQLILEQFELVSLFILLVSFVFLETNKQKM